MPRISEADNTPGFELGDEIISQKGSSDYSGDLGELVEFVMDNGLDAQRILNLIKPVATNSSGLNANTLQGMDANFFRDPSNLAGMIPRNKIPGGTTSSTKTPGGTWGTGRNAFVLRFPEEAFGIKLMIQFGYSYFVSSGGNQTVNFNPVFSGGLLDPNQPHMILSPECRADYGRDGTWDGVSNDEGDNEVELDIRLYYADLTRFAANAIRTNGSHSDTVRANWIAIGVYE